MLYTCFTQILKRPSFWWFCLGRIRQRDVFPARSFRQSATVHVSTARCDGPLPPLHKAQRSGGATLAKVPRLREWGRASLLDASDTRSRSIKYKLTLLDTRPIWKSLGSTTCLHPTIEWRALAQACACYGERPLGRTIQSSLDSRCCFVSRVLVTTAYALVVANKHKKKAKPCWHPYVHCAENAQLQASPPTMLTPVYATCGE